MKVVFGASGRVGSAIVEQLRHANVPVRAVVHSAEKRDEAARSGAEVVVADVFDRQSVQEAMQGADTVSVLTPETGHSEDVIGETKTILANYHAAIAASPTVERVVGLSSLGAQYPVGNLEMSYLLERAFIGLHVQTIFVRPAYFYSNWLLFVPTAKEHGILPTFYPIDQKIPMTAPQDIAAFVAEVMASPAEGSLLYEVTGPSAYSSRNVADALTHVLGRTVTAEQIPREKWGDQLRQGGFTDDAVKNFVAMTDLVVKGDTDPEGKGAVPIQTETTLQEYLDKNARG